MKVPDDVGIIPPTKIAVEEQINIEQLRHRSGKRNLQNSNIDELKLVYFANETNRFYERMQLIDALELKITPPEYSESSTKVDFTWDVAGYS